jgi:hypothetical protein
VSESGQQPLVDTTILIVDVGIAVVLITLGALLVWRVIDLFKKEGHWKKELIEEASAVDEDTCAKEVSL